MLRSFHCRAGTFSFRHASVHLAGPGLFSMSCFQQNSCGMCVAVRLWLASPTGSSLQLQSIACSAHEPWAPMLPRLQLMMACVTPWEWITYASASSIFVEHYRDVGSAPISLLMCLPCRSASVPLLQTCASASPWTLSWFASCAGSTLWSSLPRRAQWEALAPTCSTSWPWTASWMTAKSSSGQWSCLTGAPVLCNVPYMCPELCMGQGPSQALLGEHWHVKLGSCLADLMKLSLGLVCKATCPWLCADSLSTAARRIRWQQPV